MDKAEYDGNKEQIIFFKNRLRRIISGIWDDWYPFLTFVILTIVSFIGMIGIHFLCLLY